jgi:hypothetical protein
MVITLNFGQEPSDLNKVITVEQRSFGYLSSSSEKSYIETRYLMTCIGVYMRDEKGVGILAHIDKGIPSHTYNNASSINNASSAQALQAREMISILKSSGIGRITESYLIKTYLVPKREFEEVGDILKMETGITPEILDSKDMSAHFIADKHGNCNWLKNYSIKHEYTPYNTIKRLNENPHIVCVNELAGHK